MAYSRREVHDYVDIMNKDLYDNLQDGIEEAFKGNSNIEKDILEKISEIEKTQNIQTYTSLSQLGLVEGSETLYDITKVLPNNSELQIVIPPSHNLEIYPTANGGSLIAKKTEGSCKFEYIDTSVPEMWICAVITDPDSQDYSLTNWEKISRENEHNLRSYTSFEQIGVTVGEETIEDIVNSLPDQSILTVVISDINNTALYPKNSGTLKVLKKSPNVTFEFDWLDSGSAPEIWNATYFITDSAWCTWSKNFSETNKPTPDQIQGIIPISKGGTGAETLEQAQINLGITVKSNIELFFDVTEAGILKVTYDDGSEE